MVKRRSLQAYVLLFGVLVLGTVIGGGGTYAYMRNQAGAGVDRDGGRERARLDALTRELDLTGEQRTRVEGILQANQDERAKRMRAMFETCGEPVREHKRRVDADIRAALTPAQQKRFDELADEQEKRFFPRRDAGSGP
ncbi:hypothetical protein [Polyangium aurulentum]|uniref:hypothetical protein n=1 Tax=Polyangium aurulentum TaxID=2567896 RepID=UPI0010ADBF91|nr:hypothetical protein [Polyangium aurulentum]UQA63109.1 hypothetical protein E8A73_022655 [Polyangium aurulentum]